MADTYAQFVNSSIGKQLAGRLGMPRPARLRRYTPGGPVIDGPVVVGGHGAAPFAARVASMLREEDIAVATELPESGKVSAVVADLSTIETPADLESLRALVASALKLLAPSGRVLILGAAPQTAGDDVAMAAARRALEGITRSIGKELRAGSTANLFADGGEKNIDAAVRFFLSGRSAYVDGQVVVVGSTAARRVVPAPDWSKPLSGKVAVVTGAARGMWTSEVCGQVRCGGWGLREGDWCGGGVDLRGVGGRAGDVCDGPVMVLTG